MKLKFLRQTFEKGLLYRLRKVWYFNVRTKHTLCFIQIDPLVYVYIETKRRADSSQ
jgi:hypothetical protein